MPALYACIVAVVLHWDGNQNGWTVSASSFGETCDHPTSAMRARKNSGSEVLPEVARMVKRAKKIVLLARDKGALDTERDGGDAVVLGRVDPGRTCALRLVERDCLT